ncbi:MAG: glycosyltransferase family 39 protein, partial [Thermoleophilia bacterium]|nr:glycosyltransferase family 39 protein [Thermoleophilia bacterium]
ACSYAQRIATGQEFPLADGNMSFGLPDPALDVYLYALPTLFSDTPLAAVLFVAGLNLLAVAGIYLLAERFFSRRAALFAALFYAAAPWAVIYGRKAWVHVQPLLTVLMLWFLCQAVCGRAVQSPEQRRSWAIAGFLFLLGLQGQTHLLAVLFLPAAALSLLVFRKRIAGRPFWLGLGLAIVVSLPYLIYMLS